VIRDFRENSRGIRVYGGRVITSDPDWKYVNVRRLLIFIEASINRGLQWVVFEPNAEPLWARVRRSIANFLTLVWRNGALEGTKVEEAFFVRCDRTTMTQTDIGRRTGQARGIRDRPDRIVDRSRRRLIVAPGGI
jgi:phage tail sheath protein FI